MLNHMLPGIRRIPLGYRVFVGIPSVSYVNTHVPSRFTAVEDQRGRWAVHVLLTPTGTSIITTQSAQTAKPRFLQPAHRRAGRIAEDLDDGRRAHDPGPRNVVVSVVARLGGAGEASCRWWSTRERVTRVTRVASPTVERPSALEPRGRSKQATRCDHESLSFSYSSDGAAARDVRRVRDDDPRTDADPD